MPNSDHLYIGQLELDSTQIHKLIRFMNPLHINGIHHDQLKDNKHARKIVQDPDLVNMEDRTSAIHDFQMFKHVTNIILVVLCTFHSLLAVLLGYV